MFQIYMDTKYEIKWVPILFLHHLPNIFFSIQQGKTHTNLERHESEYLLLFCCFFGGKLSILRPENAATLLLASESIFNFHILFTK